MIRRLLLSSLCAAAALLPRAASADVLLTPFAGVSFLTEDTKKPVYGVGIALGGLIGLEAELAQTRLGDWDIPRTPIDFEAKMTTGMVNLVLRVPTGPVQPYATGGVGFIRVSGDVTVPFVGSVLSVSGQDLGMNVGGGIYLFPSRHIGLRGDVRYVRSFGELSVDNLRDIVDDFDVPLPKFDYWRVTGGLTLRF